MIDKERLLEYCNEMRDLALEEAEKRKVSTEDYFRGYACAMERVMQKINGEL